jgi:putative flavoprotein involved in K+ transport
MEHIDTIIVGAGQAGLATSYYLQQQGREHLVLEQSARPAHVWHDQRWDSFTLVTPNWSLKMPGAAYDGPDPDGFLSRDEIVAYFDRYVDQFQMPVRYNTRVTAVEARNGNGYRVTTPEQTFAADNVVIATGYEQHPRIPSAAASLSPAITQVHSSRYRNPQSLPDGAVLVVGSAQSGCQIAEELYQQGRQVFLCVGGAGRAPRRYRDNDIFTWLYRCGFFDITPDKLPMPRERFAAPHVSGTMGGHTLDLHQFARDGVRLLGHLRGAAGEKITLAPDLHESLARVDHFEREVQKMVDGYIQSQGIDAPADELPQRRDGYEQPLVEEIDLEAEGISTIIWATGFTYDYGLVKAPVLDGGGFPLQTRGVTNQPGLFFVGMPWMPSLKTGILPGVGESAAHIASCLAPQKAAVGSRG